MTTKILLTGGSGFIGTNLLEFLIDMGFEVLNIDIMPPRNDKHSKFWKKTDITIYIDLETAILKYNPDYLIHLAARTDLNGNNLSDYAANTIGTENLCKILSEKKSNVKKIIFTSSMLVCKAGYIPQSITDYCPTTTYGQSKVIGEKIVKQYSAKLPSWSIIRPTSIWGPWFDVPYIDFFRIVLSNKFIFPLNITCTKTYGYVENSCDQIYKILFDTTNNSIYKTLYIGDEPPINIDEWAEEISRIGGLGKTWRVPYFVIYLFALIGDVLKIVHVNFPMSSFRLKNMTTNNIILLEETVNICGSPVNDRKEGIKRTLTWMKLNKSI